jgi:hypothetical protein
MIGYRYGESLVGAEQNACGAIGLTQRENRRRFPVDVEGSVFSSQLDEGRLLGASAVVAKGNGSSERGGRERAAPRDLHGHGSSVCLG